MCNYVRKLRSRTDRRVFIRTVSAAIALTVAGHAAGQPQSSGPISTLPTLTPQQPRQIGMLQTSPGDAAVDAFIDSIKANDAAIQVVVGQGRLITLKQDIASDEKSATIAVGDPSIADFQILPNPRLIRVIGVRPGVTDVSITTSNDESVALEVHVTYDLKLLEARLRQVFPAAKLRLGQVREHLVVEGQARNTRQTAQIVELLEAYLASLQTDTEQQSRTLDPSIAPPGGGPTGSRQAPPLAQENQTSIELGGIDSVRAQAVQAKVINLIRVPGSQQVLLKVRIAELNRTAMREIGADILAVDPQTGNILGTQIGGGTIAATSAAGLGGLLSNAQTDLGTSSTAFGLFPSGDFQVILRALRSNGVLRILAEPNLITMSGHQANFLAGGEFPVPVPQSAGNVGSNTVTVDFREFGVRLEFLPYVVDEDRIRLSVTPEVSTIDFTLGTTLVVGGDPVPGLNTRRANTTVEMRQGQTLAMAGLLQVELEGRTNRIPGLGDLPYLGPLFSNTTHRRVEKELVVLVTPHLVAPLEDGEHLPLPGDALQDPTDHEFYFENEYEGMLGVHHRSTVQYGLRQTRRIIDYEERFIPGPVGFSE